MKTTNQRLWAAPMVIAALCLTLFSFISMPGAHSFQVYLDNKLIADQYIARDFKAPKVVIDATEKYNDIIVKYNECNRTVSGRSLSLKDEHDNILKQWNFEGQTSGFKDPMICKVKDIIALKPKGDNTLKLYYSSADFKEGQLVANLVIGTEVGRTP
jgi:hypothetical protein